MTTVNIQSLQESFPDGSPPPTLGWFREGIVPPASGGLALANRLNTVMGRRLRPLLSYTNVYGLHAKFDAASTSDLICHYGAFHTGPLSSVVAWRGAFLPALGSPNADGIYVYVNISKALSGTFSNDYTAQLFMPIKTTNSNLSIDDVIESGSAWILEPDSFYRIEVGLHNKARMVSSSVYEFLPITADTSFYTSVVDPTDYRNGQPITQQQIDALNRAADKIWRRGPQIGWWTTDIPGDERTRSSATQANLWDQTVTTPTGTSPGWLVDKPYSGSLDSSNVPVIFWAVADCTSGTGTITFRDQNNTTLGTVNPTGAKDWYWTTGNLSDASLSAQTTKIDVFFAGDGTHTTKVYACGCFMHVSDDPYLAPSPVSGFAPLDNRNPRLTRRAMGYVGSAPNPK